MGGDESSFFLQLQAWRGPLDNECGEALGSGLRLGRGEDDIGSRDPGVRDEAFCTIKNVAVALLLSSGRYRADVTSGFGLGESESRYRLAPFLPEEDNAFFVRPFRPE